MNWDPIKQAQRFLQRASSFRPEKGTYDYEENLAMQNLLDECYMLSFSKDKLIEFLKSGIAGTIKDPEEIDADTFRFDKYRAAYSDGAKGVLLEIEKF